MDPDPFREVPGVPPDPTPRCIPRVAHFYWTGSPIPGAFLSLLRRFIALNPGWTAKVWADENLPPLANAALFRAIPRLAFKADVVRYEIVARYGGVWLDWDIVHLRSIDTIAAGAPAFVCPEQNRRYNNGVFGFSRGHPAAWALVSNLARNFKVREGEGLFEQVGVGYFTRTVRRYAASVSVVPPDFFHPYYGRDVRAGCDLTSHPCAIGIHFFNSNNVIGRVQKLIDAGKIPVPPAADAEIASRIRLP